MRNLLHGLAALLLLLPVLASSGEASALSLPATQITNSTEKAALTKLETANDALSEADTALGGGDDAALTAARDDAQVNYDTALERARSLRDAGDGKSGELGQAIFAITGDTAADGSFAGMGGMIASWTTQGKEWVVEEAPSWAGRAAIFLLIIFIFKVLAGVAGKITGKALTASKLSVSDLLKKFFVGIVTKLVFFAGFMIALEQLGVPTGPLLAGVGVVGFVIGFALQDTLSNFAAGIMILLYRPYDIGDVISAAGETGKVDDMSLVSTTMMTPDNQKLIIPNSSIWGGTIRNITALDSRRVDLVIGVGYDDDLDRTQEILLEVASAHSLVFKDPAPVVKVTNLGESSVDFVVRPWCKTGDYWDVYWDLTKTIKQRLDREGISIPYPQRDLHLVQVPEKMALST